MRGVGWVVVIMVAWAEGEESEEGLLLSLSLSSKGLNTLYLDAIVRYGYLYHPDCIWCSISGRLVTKRHATFSPSMQEV